MQWKYRRDPNFRNDVLQCSSLLIHVRIISPGSIVGVSFTHHVKLMVGSFYALHYNYLITFICNLATKTMYDKSIPHVLCLSCQKLKSAIQDALYGTDSNLHIGSLLGIKWS
jgi:hypothetical protein